MGGVRREAVESYQAAYVAHSVNSEPKGWRGQRSLEPEVSAPLRDSSVPGLFLNGHQRAGHTSPVLGVDDNASQMRVVRRLLKRAGGRRQPAEDKQ